MLIDIGFAPIVTILIAFIALAILSDFLLELVSVRSTLSTGRFQNWLFDHFGQSSFYDILIAVAFQLISFRKRAFFMQLSSFVNVGSFSRRQALSITLGAFIGWGLSAGFLLLIHPIVGIALGLIGFVLTFFTKDQLKDLGIAFLNFGLLILAVFFFNQFLATTSLNIHQYDIGEGFVFLIIFFTSVFFRTPIAFLLMLSMVHYLIGLSSWWLPVAYFSHGILFLGKYYFHFFRGHQRLYFTLGMTLGLQVLQCMVAFALVFVFHNKIDALIVPSHFLSSYFSIVLGYIVYFSLSVVIILPLIYLFLISSVFNEVEKKKGSVQKILSLPQRGNLFSLHFSMFLLRQEFIKFTTLVHTIFKLSREADVEEESVNEKLTRYQRILIRVGEEIKELCFSVGKQRSYKWHVQEILVFYKHVNQLELLVDDLSQIYILLQSEDLDEEWEKECRYWLNLQLLIFESFFNYVVGVGKDDPDKVKNNIEKSYDVLERLFSEDLGNKKVKILSKNFYRVTESNGELAL